MNRPPVWLALVALLFLAGCEETEPVADGQMPSGTYDVAWTDRRFPVAVEGTLRIDESGAAIMQLQHPGTRETHALSATSPQRRGDGFEYMFEGSWPGANSLTLEPLGQPVQLNTGNKLVLKHKGAELQIEIDSPSEEKSRGLIVHFGAANGVLLSGRWSYRADPDTGYGEEGIGPLGSRYLDYENKQVVLWGDVHVAQPSPPTIFAAFPLEEQIKQIGDKAAWAYPWDNAGNETDTAFADRGRRLFVIGENLPADSDTKSEFSSLDPALHYNVVAWPGDNEPGGRFEPDFRRGFEILEDNLEETEFAQLRDAEAMVIEVRADDGILPGRKSFTLNGAPADWDLRYGDFTAVLSAVRPVANSSHGTEDIQFAFRPERLQFELRADRVLPYPTIPLLVMHGDQRVQDPGEDYLIAKRLAEDPRTYRTEAVALNDHRSRLSGSRGIDVEPGDQFFATVVDPRKLITRPAVASMRVVKSPATVAPEVLPGSDEGLLFKDALRQAWLCYADEEEDTLPPWEELAKGRSDKVYNYVLFAKGEMHEHILETDIRLGDHAALLFQRSVFSEIARTQARSFTVLQSDPLLMEGMFLSFERMVRREDPIFEVEITAPDGNSRPYRDVFYRDAMRREYKMSPSKLREWQYAKTAEALRGYAQAVRNSVAQLNEIDPCDPAELLDVIGWGFQSVTAEARTRLMRLDEQGVPPNKRLVWVPDEEARKWLSRVAYLGRQLRNNEGLAARDSASIWGALSLGSIPVMAVGGKIAFLAAALDIADLGYTATTELAAQYEQSRELEFALGAAAVLGIQRYKSAQAMDRPWYTSAMSIGLSAVSASTNFHGPIGSPRSVRAADLGDELVSSAPMRPAPDTPDGDLPPGWRLTDEEIDGLTDWVGSLHADQQDFLFASLSRARAQARAGGRRALRETTRRAFDMSQALVQGAEIGISMRPSWAADLSDAAFDRIATMQQHRSDIRELVRQNPKGMDILIQDDIGLDILRRGPFLTFEEFERAVIRQRRNLSLPARPEAHYASCAPGELPEPPPGYHVTGERARPSLMRGKTAHVTITAGQPGQNGLHVFSAWRARRSINGSYDELMLDVVDMERRLPNPLDPYDPVGAWDDIPPARPVADPDYAPLNSSVGTQPKPLAEVAPEFVITTEPLVPGRGTPTALYGTLRTMRMLGIDYADPKIARITIDQVKNADASAQLVWARKAYPDLELNELAPMTSTYRYVESIARLAGLKVTGARILNYRLDRASPAASIISDTAPYFSKKFSPDDFMRRHGLQPDDPIPTGYKMIFDVEPIF